MLIGRAERNNLIMSIAKIFEMCYHIHMKINEYFKSQYLVAGNTYDNYIFENCPIEFLFLAEKSLSKKNNGVKPCNINLGKIQQEEIEKVFLNCNDIFQKKPLASYYITTLIMAELFKGIDEKQYQSLQNQLQSFKENDFKKIKQNYLDDCYMPFDVAKQSRKLGQKIELNIFLIDINNVILQQVVNNFISSREPYSVKIFTTNKLCAYYDHHGNIIQSPHDYMNINVNNFINIEQKEERNF